MVLFLSDQDQVGSGRIEGGRSSKQMVWYQGRQRWGGAQAADCQYMYQSLNQ